MRLSENYGMPANVHGFQKLDGILALLKNETILEEEIAVGDRVSLFSLPDGKFLLSKDPEGILVSKITSAHICFDVDVNIEEK